MRRLAPSELARYARTSRRVELPFGKHRGKTLGTVPAGYRRWMLANLADLAAGMRAAVALSLDCQPADHPAPPRTPRAPAAVRTPAPARTGRYAPRDPGPPDPADDVDIDAELDRLAAFFD